jgi:hypothetical protein
MPEAVNQPLKILRLIREGRMPEAVNQPLKIMRLIREGRIPEAVNQPLKKTLRLNPCRWMVAQWKGLTKRRRFRCKLKRIMWWWRFERLSWQRVLCCR